MEFKDYYQIMGVARDAKQDEVKRAYRRLARKYHPDVSKETDAEQRFKEMQEAYEVLKDPEKRKAYDQFGNDWKAGQEFHPPPDWDRNFEFHGGGFTDEADFSDFFETLFGRSHPGAARQAGGGFRMRGQNQQARIAVHLDEAFQGSVRSLSLAVPEIDAQGKVVNKSRTLNVKIPAGVIENQRIRLVGQGSSGMGGAPAGDLFLEIVFEPHKWFRADRRDIHLELPITPWEAALGRKISVPTLGGKVELTIPAGSQSGQKLRLKGRGLPGKAPGDQLVTLKIVTPKADTDAARALYQQLERELPMNPRAELEGQ